MGQEVILREVTPGSDGFEAVLALADQVLAQRRYIVSVIPSAGESHVLGAFDDTGCVGFLRYYVQVIGAEEGRPPVVRQGAPLREGFVEALGVAPGARRRGIGSALQAKARRVAGGSAAIRCDRGAQWPAWRTTP
ncbi:MAG: GNAT family N-acetyltransferase [Acidimicrobiales bacterium]